jgi:hypothetical protein
MLGDACGAAGVGGIPVELALRDGTRVTGTPSPQPAVEAESEVGSTGYADSLRIDDVWLSMRDVVEFVIRTP